MGVACWRALARDPAGPTLRPAQPASHRLESAPAAIFRLWEGGPARIDPAILSPASRLQQVFDRAPAKDSTVGGRSRERNRAFDRWPIPLRIRVRLRRGMTEARSGVFLTENFPLRRFSSSPPFARHSRPVESAGNKSDCGRAHPRANRSGHPSPASSLQQVFDPAPAKDSTVGGRLRANRNRAPSIGPIPLRRSGSPRLDRQGAFLSSPSRSSLAPFARHSRLPTVEPPTDSQPPERKEPEPQGSPGGEAHRCRIRRT